MPALVCPHCRALTNFGEVWRGDVFSGSEYAGQAFYDIALRCSNEACGRVIGGVRHAGSSARVAQSWPTHVGGKSFPDVPSEIAAAADEAHRCFSIRAYRAAMAMARAVVEATAKEKGITSGSLEKKIDGLAAQGLIREDTREAAHAIRLVGNDAAHGDLASMVVEKEDAQEVLDLMDDILGEVFQSPAKVARVKASRAARVTAARGQQTSASAFPKP
ncbi:DUF4145 domain-containing protein [Micromonospora sp. IBSANI012]|uniref:DUF4145 domain-containing protein n=1 Tax=Micromonospora sp. IBSANI012 TaxID=3457761 RepID=UPI00405952A4